MKTSAKSLRDMWMWQVPMLRVVVGFIVLVPILAGCVLYRFLGAKAFAAFPFAGIGLLGWLVYSKVGKKVERLRRSITPAEGEVADGLIVNGIIQSPGIVVLKASEIEFVPIVGKAISIPFSTITSVRECRWFNGVYYKWKTGFWLTVPGKKRLGFVVATSLADKWRDLLSPAKEPKM